MEVDGIEIRQDTATKPKRTPMTKDYKPASTAEHRGIENCFQAKIPCMQVLDCMI